MKQVKRMVLSVVLVFMVALGIWTFHDVQASDSESTQDNLAGMPTTWAANVGANKIDDHEYKVEPFSADEAIVFLNGDNQYPDAPEGYLFAGWYTNELCDDTCMLKGATPTDTVYALFVPEDVLSIKAQISTNLLDSDSTNDETGAIRFVTTVDSLRYKEVGFELSYVDSNDVTHRAVSKSNKVYSRLIEMIGTAVSTARPESTFCGLSQYFKACTIQNLPISDFKDIKFKVEPYWITMDGDKVYGVSAERSIQDGCDFLGAVDAKIAGHKYGVAGNSLADGTEITLTKKDSDVTKTAQITNGKISKTELEVGTWTVQADGYLPIEILVSEGTYSKDIILEYELFTNYLKEELSWTDYPDLSEMNDGTVTQAFGGSMFLVSKDTYDSVAISLNLSTTGLTGGRHGTFVKFGNDCVFIQVEPKNSGQSYELTWNDFGIKDWLTGTALNNITGSWNAQAAPLSEEQIAGLNDGSLYFTLVREGNEILAYIDGQYCNKLTLAETYTDMECQVGIYGMTIKEGMVRNFKIDTTGAIDAQISGNKLGIKGSSLEDGTEITLTHKETNTVKIATIKDGKICLDDLNAGVWTISKENYLSQDITLATGITHSKDIVLEYELLENYMPTVNYSNITADLTKMNSGIVAPNNNNIHLFLVSKDTYDSVAISVNLSTVDLVPAYRSEGRYGAFVKFGEEFVFIQLYQGAADKPWQISWNNFQPTGAGNWLPDSQLDLTNITDTWEQQVSELSEAQIAGLNNGSLYFTLVRKGNEIYAFVGDEYCNKLTLEEKYADMKCQVGVYGRYITANHPCNFKIEDGASYLSSNETIGFVDAKITGHKHGVKGNNFSDGTQVTFIHKDNETTETATIQNGKICLNGLKLGTWTVQAEGYLPTEIDITGGTYSKEIVLEYELLKNYMLKTSFTDITADLSKMNEGVVAPNNDKIHLFLGSQDAYDSVAVSVNLSTQNLLASGKDYGKYGVFVEFDDNEYVLLQMYYDGKDSYYIAWDDMSFGSGGWLNADNLKNITGAVDTTKQVLHNLTEADIAKLDNGELYYSLVREENHLYAYVGDKCVGTLELDEKYATQKCHVGVYGRYVTSGHTFNFKIADDCKIDTKITGNKLGIKGSSLEDGTEITLTHKETDTTKIASIQNGTLIVNDLKPGIWTVSAEGHFATDIAILENTYSKEIVLEYELLKNYMLDAQYTQYTSNNITADLSKVNKGVVKTTNGKHLLLGSQETYSDVAVSVNLSTTDLMSSSHGRYGVFVQFGQELVLLQLYALKGDDGVANYNISWNNTSLSDWLGTTTLSNITQQESVLKVLTEDDVAALNEGTLYFTLVRKENVIYAYIGNECKGSITLDEAYKNTQCKVGVYGRYVETGHTFNFKIEDGTSYLQSHPVTGTTVASQTTGYKLKKWIQRTASSLNNKRL